MWNSPLIILLLFITSAVLSQPEKNRDKLTVTLAPLALIDIYDSASLRVDAELKLSENWVLYAEAGPYLPYLKATKIDVKETYFSPGIKYYFSQKKYFAFDYFFKEQQYGFDNKLRIDNQKQTVNYDMERKVHRVSLKLGKLKHYKNVTLDWYGGIGLRYIDSAAHLSAQDQEQLSQSTGNECTVQENMIRKTGKFWMPDVSLGLKIGCKLW